MCKSFFRRHIFGWAVVFFAVFLLLISGTVYADSPSVTVWPFPETLPEKYKSGDFSVQVETQNVPVYQSGLNAWGNPVSYASFETDGEVTVRVTLSSSVSSVSLLPNSLNKTAQINGNEITFSALPGEDITVLPNGDYNGKALHLFIRSPLENAPDSNSENVLYYGPGYYDLSDQGPILVNSGQTVYIAGGAVIRGRFLVSDASQVTICGPGILINDYTANDGYDEVAIALKDSQNVTIRDLTVARDVNAWTAFMWKCSDVTVKNYKSINAKYASSDGFNIANCQNVLFDHVFIRSCDDSVALKGTGTAGYDHEEDPSAALPTCGIVYQNAQLWSDANNAIGLGAETVAAYFRDIHFNNIDILRSFDDLNYPDQLVERSAINICALNATDIGDVTFENIRVENAKRLIGITMADSFWFGSLPGNWSWPGSIHDITYKNITSSSGGSNQIRITGHDANHRVQNITLENIMVGDALLSSGESDLFYINEYAQNIRLVCAEHPDGVVINGPLYPQALEHNAAREFSTVQGETGWYYRIWQAGVGTNDMVWNPDGSGHWRGSGSWDAVWVLGDSLYIHPDATQILVEWTAPRSGTADVSGVVRKFATEGGDGVTVSIWKNGTMIWPENGQWMHIASNDAVGCDAKVTTDLNAGDVLSFRVDKFGDTAYDTTEWTPVIRYEN